MNNNTEEEPIDCPLPKSQLQPSGSSHAPSQQRQHHAITNATSSRPAHTTRHSGSSMLPEPERPPSLKMFKSSARMTIADFREEGMISCGASFKIARRSSTRSSLLSSRTRQMGKTQKSIIMSIMKDLQWALAELVGGDGDDYDDDTKLIAFEEWATFVHESLTSDVRRYHDVQHVFEITAGASGLQCLAAHFRHVISFTIDGGFDQMSSKQKELVDGIFHPPNTCILNPNLGKQIHEEQNCNNSNTGTSRCDELVAMIFGFSPGQNLESAQGLHKGFDVFLSAIVATRLLKDALSLAQAAQLAVCLEGTIPFRQQLQPFSSRVNSNSSLSQLSESKNKDDFYKFNSDKTDTVSMEALYQRLVECNDKFDLRLSDEEMEETVQQAADLLNRSVGNMVSDDLAQFLNKTWQLLPEHNTALRDRCLYTLADYYEAVGGMVRNLWHLKERTSVCASFRGLPDVDETEAFQLQLQSNLRLAILYVRARFFSAAVVSALACLTGGDHAPKCFFYGDLSHGRSDDTESDELGDGLPLPCCVQDDGGDGSGDSSDDAAAPLFNKKVADLLCGHDMTETKFDTLHAPFCAFLYRRLGDKRVAALYDDAEAQYCPLPRMTEQAAEALLRELPNDVLQQVGEELGRIAVSRASRLKRLVKRLSNDDG